VITPAIEEALLLLLSVGDVSVSSPAAEGVTAGPPRLDDIWLTESVVYQAADEAGITRAQASRAAFAVSCCVRDYQESLMDPEAPRLALASELGKARLASDELNAADFVSLVGMEHVRMSMRDHSSKLYGSKTEEASIKLAEHLAKKYA
jgi:hypothetical protein